MVVRKLGPVMLISRRVDSSVVIGVYMGCGWLSGWARYVSFGGGGSLHILWGVCMGVCMGGYGAVCCVQDVNVNVAGLGVLFLVFLLPYCLSIIGCIGKGLGCRIVQCSKGCSCSFSYVPCLQPRHTY